MRTARAKSRTAIAARVAATILLAVGVTAYAEGVLIGDMNGDGVVNAFDIDPFVACLTAGGGGHAGPIDWWPLDACGRDMGAYANHGAMEGDVTVSETMAPVDGNCASMYFDGAGDYVNLGTKLLPEGQFDQFTFEAWFRADAEYLDPSSPHWTIFAFETTDGEMNVFADRDTGRLRLTIYTQVGGPLNLWGPVVTAGAWHKVVVRKDESTIRLLLDDVQVDMAMAESPLRVNGDWHATIGCKYTDDPAHFFAGWIDEVKIHDRALSYVPPCTGDVPLEGTPSGIVISHSGDVAYVCCHGVNKIFVVDTQTCTVTHVIDVGLSPGTPALSADDERLYVPAYPGGSSPGYLKIYETADYNEIESADAGVTPVSVALSADGRRAYVGNHITETLKVINVDESDSSGFTDEVAELDTGDGQSGGDVVISPDGGTVYFGCGSGSNHVAVIDADTVSDVYSMACTTTQEPGQHGSIALSPLHARLYGAKSGELLVVDTLDPCAPAPWEHYTVCSSPKSIAVSYDGSRVFVVCENEDVVLVLDAETMVIVKEIPVGSNPQRVACHPAYPNGQLIYVTAAGDGVVQIIDVDEE